MKKIFTLFAVAAMAVTAYAQIPESKSWTFENGSGDVTSTTTIDGLTLTPKSGQKFTYNAQTREVDGVKYTARLRFNKDGNINEQNASFQVPGDCRIYVVAASDNATATDRFMYIATSEKELLTQQMSSATKYTVSYNGPETTIYIYFKGGCSAWAIGYEPNVAEVEAPAHDQAEGVVKFDGTKEVVFTPAADSHVVYTSFVAAVTNDAQALAADPTIEHEGKTFTLAADNKVTVDKSGVLHYFAMDPATGVKSPVNTIEFSQTTGINDIDVDNASAPVEYFNLQGIRVENPTNGLYIRRQGNKVTKVVL